MFTYTRQIKDEEMKAVEHFVPDFKEWIDHMIEHKIEQRVNALVKDNSDKQPKKIIHSEKLAIIAGLNLSTRKERDQLEEKERLSKLKLT